MTSCLHFWRESDLRLSVSEEQCLPKLKTLHCTHPRVKRPQTQWYLSRPMLNFKWDNKFNKIDQQCQESPEKKGCGTSQSRTQWHITSTQQVPTICQQQVFSLTTRVPETWEKTDCMRPTAGGGTQQGMATYSTYSFQSGKTPHRERGGQWIKDPFWLKASFFNLVRAGQLAWHHWIA